MPLLAGNSLRDQVKQAVWQLIRDGEPLDKNTASAAENAILLYTEEAKSEVPNPSISSFAVGCLVMEYHNFLVETRKLGIKPNGEIDADRSPDVPDEIMKHLLYQYLLISNFEDSVKPKIYVNGKYDFELFLEHAFEE